MRTEKRNSTIILGLLVAVVALGIGYAAITGVNLLINGTSSVKSGDGDFVVRFVKNIASETAIDNPVENAIKISGKNADDSAMDVSGMSATVVDDTHATFSAGELDEVGEYVEFTYTVVNESEDIDAMLSFDVAGENNSDYFEVTKNVSKDKISENETATVKVKITLTATPKVENVNATFAVTLNAIPVEAGSEESGGQGGGDTQTIPDPVSFSTDSWETIIKAVKDNNTSAYNVGDEKTISFNDELVNFGTKTVRISNMSTPEECSNDGFSQTACGFVLEFADIITSRRMDRDDTNVGGWPATDLRTYINSDIYDALPSELKDAIKETKVVSGHGSNDSANFTSTDKLYLLSSKEVFGKEGTSRIVDVDTAEVETRQLDYYKAQGVTTSNPSKASKQADAYWWLRSAYSSSKSSFFHVENRGDWSGYSAVAILGVSPAFRLG